MKIENSLQGLFGSTQQRKSGANGDAASFLLPDDDSDDSSAATPSVSSAGVASSISSGFWLNQSGASSDPSGETDSSDTDSASDSLSSDALLAEFSKWANMSPAEKIRAQYLDEHQLTEDQLKQLPSDQQKAINDAITQEIKQKLGTDKQSDDEKAVDGSDASVTLG